jgi:hypothetical protein
VCERPVGLVAPVRIDPAGVSGPTRHQAAGPSWRRTSPGLYVPGYVDSQVVEQRIVEQESRLAKTGAISAWAALRWRGAAYFEGRSGRDGVLGVPLAVGKECLRPDPAFLRLRRSLPASEFEIHQGLRCATWQRALFDEISRLGSLRPAVVAAEMTLAAGLGTVQGFWEFLDLVRPRNGVVLARSVAALARGRSRSPQEVWMWLCWCLDAGLPEPLCNVPVFDLSGNLLGVPDLFDPDAGVVGEYQGAVHRDQAQHRRDVERAERFRSHRLEYFEVVAGQLYDFRTATRMRQVRSRAAFLPPSQRTWTLDVPQWWRARHG